MKNLLLLFITIFISSQLFGQISNQIFVYFDSDQFGLDEEAISNLESLLEDFALLNQPKLLLSGHTDNEGNAVYNIALSEKRVNAVRDFLTKNGVGESTLSLDYFGENKPVASNVSETDRRSNRRVEITILENESHTESTPIVAPSSVNEILKEPIRAPVKEAISYGNPLDVLADFESKPQLFCINNNRDTIVQGENGTILFFKAGTFDDKKMSCDCIELQLREFYSPQQIILNNLNTQSDNRLLETQGSIELRAFCEGKVIPLKRGKALDIFFPGDNIENDFQLFTGNEEEEQVNWKKNTRTYTSDFFEKGFGCGNSGGNKFKRCNYDFFLRNWICSWKSKRDFKKREKRWEKTLKDLREAYAGINFTNFNNQLGNTNYDMRLYASSKLGYINCDRFLNKPRRNLANIYVKDSSEVTITTSIVFKKINSIMNGRMDDKGRHWYMRIPKNMDAWVIAIKREGDDYFLSIKDYKRLKKEITDLEFKPVSEEELLASLNEIGW